MAQPWIQQLVCSHTQFKLPEEKMYYISIENSPMYVHQVLDNGWLTFAPLQKSCLLGVMCIILW